MEERLYIYEYYSKSYFQLSIKVSKLLIFPLDLTILISLLLLYLRSLQVQMQARHSINSSRKLVQLLFSLLILLLFSSISHQPLQISFLLAGFYYLRK